jgi:hypothetical protein
VAAARRVFAVADPPILRAVDDSDVFNVALKHSFAAPSNVTIIRITSAYLWRLSIAVPLEVYFLRRIVDHGWTLVASPLTSASPGPGLRWFTATRAA